MKMKMKRRKQKQWQKKKTTMMMNMIRESSLRSTHRPSASNQQTRNSTAAFEQESLEQVLFDAMHNKQSRHLQGIFGGQFA